MNKSYIVLLLIMSLAPFLVQCASREDMHSTNVKVYSIDSQVQDIDQEVAQLRNETVKQVQTRQAVVDSRLDVLEADILQVKSTLEENGHYNRLLREENKEVESRLVARIEALDEALDNKLAKLMEAVNQMDGRLVATNNQINQAEASIEKINKERAEEAAEQARKAAEEARKAAEAARAAQSTIVRPNGSVQISADKHKKAVTDVDAAEQPADDGGADNDLYARSLALFKEKKVDQAYEGFADYLSKYPDGNMAANARFWMGECLYNQNEFELAILDYQKVIVDFPDNLKAPAALLKQGMAFEKLNDAETARIVYQKILDNYPASDQLATAKNRLQSLK